MKRLMMMLSLLLVLISCLAAQEMKATSPTKTPVEVTHHSFRSTDRDSIGVTYQFVTPPVNLLTSYWDYMIGGYSSLPIHVQPADQGGGVIITYMGQRTATGLRRVYYAYINQSGEVVSNNEITNNQIREGYVTSDVDQTSGKPIFAWHANSDTDSALEVQLAWDSILEGTIGLITAPVNVINNPISLTVNGTAYNDNDFDWPVVNIGPSPIEGCRRVFVSTTNSVTHCTPANPSENIYIAYADFTTEQLENGDALEWTYTSVPTLDEWNTDPTAWRRLFGTTLVGNDGKFYIIGHHVVQLADESYPTEDYLNVFVCDNYGQGPWHTIAVNPDQYCSNPVDPFTNLGYFADDSSVPYDTMLVQISQGGHINATMDPNGIIHAPMVSSLGTTDNTYYPATQYMKDVTFNTNTQQFLVHDVYPQDTHPNDGNMCLPWDLDGTGAHFGGTSSADSYLIMDTEWPFIYWDETVADDAMEFHYNMYHITKMNADGKMAMVWHDSQRSRLYNKYPDSYPELAGFAGVPETFISVYPVQTEDGQLVWSYPISLNSVETPQLANMVPSWVYPSDVIEHVSTDTQGNYYGKLHLLFFDDNTWGAASISPAVGQPDGGTVMYTSLEIKWPAITVANNDPVAAPVSMLKQNYPNPFNPVTKIAFDLPNSADVSLQIYNVKGQLVKTLFNGKAAAGSHTFEWKGLNDNNKSVASGLYFYKLTNGSHVETKKMMLMK